MPLLRGGYSCDPRVTDFLLSLPASHSNKPLSLNNLMSPASVNNFVCKGMHVPGAH
jgi:hypothetical protein